MAEAVADPGISGPVVVERQQRFGSDLRGAASCAAARVARSDDRLDGAADDRRRSRRRLASLVGRHGVLARLDDRDTAVREARRSVRAEGDPAGGDRSLPDRLGAVRTRAEHAVADRLPRVAGSRRRGADGDDDGGDRRHRRASRPGPLSGLLRRRLRRLDGDRAADRRLLRRSPLLALDLLHQPADRRSRAGGDRVRVPVPCRARAPLDRLPRCRAPRRWTLVGGALHQPRRDDLCLGVARDDRAGRARRRSARALRVRGTSRRRADPADVAVQEPDLLGHGAIGFIVGLALFGAVTYLPLYLQIVKGQERNGIRAAADADDGGRPDHLDHERQPDLADRPLQARSRSWAQRLRPWR